MLVEFCLVVVVMVVCVFCCSMLFKCGVDVECIGELVMVFDDVLLI